MYVVPPLSIILMVFQILKKIVQILAEGKEYLNKSFAYLLMIDSFLITTTICQIYYWTTGKIVNGHFIRDRETYVIYFITLSIIQLFLYAVADEMISFTTARKNFHLIWHSFLALLRFLLMPSLAFLCFFLLLRF